MIKCHGCNQDFDVGKVASGHCSEHDKDYCWQCAHDNRPCSQKGRCKLIFITNPQWIVNLRNSLGR